MTEVTECTAGDIDAVMSFLRDHWAADHVLANHRGLMDWQHAAPDGHGHHWLLARNEKGIQGVLGYIPTSRFDETLERDPFTWLALWKVRSDNADRGLGLKLLSRLLARCTGVVGVLGINPKHPPMYKALGWRVGELEHHFMCCPGVQQTLLEAPAGHTWPLPRPGLALLRELDASSIGQVVLGDSPRRQPHKTPLYFARRYLDHPIYTYRLHLVLLDGASRALLATRVATAGATKVLRVVDFLGDEAALAQCGNALARLMTESGCEYVDFWQYGLQPQTLASCGFARVEPGGPVVVPNYFEPFVLRNGRIEFAVKGLREGDRLAVFRGDGDQDRPNRLAANTAAQV
jgi:hypothetical protein